uniref:ATPase AAA-type core domain-containing protein n=1 Tax=Anopheles atroparvus TaxID=41427 RepID=A0A182IMK0_ANOAO
MMAPAVSIGSKTESIVSSSSSSSVSSLSSASGNALSTLSKAELDRLIAENMTSVLKSLKKRKHAKKHARIRQAAAAAVEIATVEETNTMAGKDDKQSNDKGSLNQKNELNMVRRRISPRKNNQANTSSAGSKTVPSKQRLKELQPKMKEESSDGTQSDTRDEGNHQQPPTAEKNGKENKTINAFQLLMGARLKSIGSNSPGRDPEVAEIDADQQSVREEKAKRKVQLQQWAERKGSGKRKLQDDAEGDYIEHQLKKRSKRLKKLIENMATEEEQVVQEKAEHTEGVRKQNKPSTVGSNSRRSSQSKKDPKALPDEDSGGKGRAYTPVEKENTEVIEIDDCTSDEFLKQLSSPTKKKDSLLGYFAKVSPDGRKKGGTPPQTKPSNEAARKVVKPIGEEPNDSTPPSELSSRPRRSCANRIKDYAAFERFSPEKVEQKKKNAPIVTPLKIINVQSPNAMKVVKSPSLRMFCSDDASTPGPIVTDRNGAEWPTTPKSVKLAPLFSRGKQQQPAIDPEKARARQLFLMSGIPEKMRQEMEKRTAYEEHVLNESPVFPLVSHVTQLEKAVARAGDLGRSCIKLRPAQTDSPPGRGAMKSRKIRFGLFTGCTVDDYEAALIRCVERDGLEDAGFDYELPEIENAKEIVRDYKLRYHHFPVFKCYKQFRSIYQDYQLVQQEERDGDGAKSELSVAQSGGKRKEGNGFKRQPSSASLNESIEIVEPTHHWRNGELLFTEKYKPQNTEQILVNYVPAKMLKRFLAPWQEDGSGPRRGTNTNGGVMGQLYGNYFTGGDAPHDDEFENSNGSSCSSAFGGGTPEVCNHVVLVGPPGCGKTCNVYAVAKEMHFNVLEINASSRRKGKIILQELLEATQSHQVRQRTERSNSLDGLVARQKLGAVGGGGGAIKKGAGSLLNGGFSCLERRPSFSETNGNGSKKLSLILIEDADIVFEQDDGFLGAINQLVATSKRPIVLTTTNPACPHMARYMARNNVIRYVAPGIANVAKFLSLLALVERIPIDQHDVGRLYAHNGKDMRKTMNEVQFFIQSGGDLVRSLTANDREDEQNDGTEECADRAKSDCSVSKMNQHTTLYQLFTRNQNEEMVLRSPLAFDTLWCNMELVLRVAKASALAPLNQQKESPAGKKNRVSTPKRQRRRETTTTGATEPRVLPPEVVLCEELGFLYENISRAEAGWGVTQRNRVRYGRDLQDEQQQQQLANEMGHALVEGSWIDWFDRRRRMVNGGGTGAKKKNSNDAGAEDEEDGAKAYDGLRKLEQEQRQTIASYIGVNGLRSRVTACDYEPLLRQICRTERERSSQERRGSRFYHYLRNFASASGAGTVTLVNGTTTTTGGFSADHVDVLSYRFEEQRPQVPATEVPEKVEQ